MSTDLPPPDLARSATADPSSSVVDVQVADPDSVQARQCIQAYFDELQVRLENGFDASLSVSADPAELVWPAGVFLVATRDGKAVGCAGLKFKTGGVGEIKRMWVSPTARGLGIARRLLTALEEQALRAGAHTLQLDTHKSLVEARALYARDGYVEIPAYNDNPYADFWFEKRLPGVTTPCA